MAVPKRPLIPHWIEHELMPYLRCAFSHELAYDTDIRSSVLRAIDRALKKADYPSDGDDLVFERICQAIQFRHKNLAPDLSIATENLETLATFLLRRAQLTGPYELLGRMNVASGAWREYEEGRLEGLRLVAEEEKKVNLTVVLDPPPKAAPTEDEIDPRLINALPGHYVAPSLRGTLTVVEDQYHRKSNASLRRYRQQQQAAANVRPQYRAPTVPGTEDWQQYPRNALPVKTLASLYVQGLGQQYTRNSMPLRTLAPSYMQGSGQQQHPQPMQAVHGPYSPPSQYNTPYAYQPSSVPVPQQQQMHHYPAQPTAMQAPWPNVSAIASPSGLMSPPANAVHQPHSTPTSITTADIAHLRGNQWTEAVEQRVHDFNHQSRPQSFQANSYQQPTMPTQQRTDTPTPTGIFGQVPMYQSAPAQSQQTYPRGLAHHPSFSNVTSAFPDVNSIYNWSMQNGRGQQ
ncbi:hypothetical protein HBH70_008670 [Parastagonospora nodorum]|nr:hypothetical protein HBH52_037020 [Parastagonospora nodorum]KAH4001077.1 hypothetical protein HBI10_096680 [Parastagonospora nodorum]KAH4033311.1 hypothetical protein HBI13_009060 [Parastagonospora nodorum]KAH4073366.1 hypothetical protein HBH50_053050 [Parastagonospora nodorum]KAH4099575.1 hypothetical protein HBH48_009110 [Parastagonospora nodorum]